LLNKVKVCNLERVNCLLCGSANYKPIITGRDRLLGLPGEFTVVECQKCSLKFTNPRPSEDEISYYYPESYHPYATRLIGSACEHGSFYKKFNTIIRKSTLGALLRRLINIDSKGIFIPDLPEEAKVLELGCATGSFLNTLRRRKLKLYGVEPGRTAALYAQKKLCLNVFCGTLEKAKFPNFNFDAIFAWHTVEHFPNPLQTLREVNRVLKKDGHFVFSIPNAGCWEFYIFGNKWYDLDLPRHLSHFTLASIKKVLEAGNFRVEKLFYQRNVSNIVVSSAYWLEDVMGKNKISKTLRRFPISSSAFLWLFSLPLATFLSAIKQAGRMTIVSRPRWQD